MDFNKFMHSKCPNCGNYSLPVVKMYHHGFSPIVQCSCCHKKYKLSKFIGVVLEIGGFILILGIFKCIDTYIFNLSNWIYYSACLIWFFLSQYFAPLYEVLD